MLRVEHDDDADREHGVESGAEVGGGARATVDELLVAAYIHGRLVRAIGFELWVINLNLKLRIGVVHVVGVGVWVGASCGRRSRTYLVLIEPRANHRFVRPRAEGFSQTVEATRQHEHPEAALAE